MNEDHGKPFSNEAGEAIKIRAEGLTGMKDLVGSVSADSDEWIATITERFRGVVAAEEQIPEIAYSMLQFLATFAAQIQNPVIYLKLTLALNEGLKGLSESMKDIAEKRCKDVLGDMKNDGADSMSQMVEEFINKCKKEKQDEDGESGVPDSGSC
jgi:hypothetical protein